MLRDAYDIQQNEGGGGASVFPQTKKISCQARADEVMTKGKPLSRDYCFVFSLCCFVVTNRTTLFYFVNHDCFSYVGLRVTHAVIFFFLDNRVDAAVYVSGFDVKRPHHSI